MVVNEVCSSCEYNIEICFTQGVSFIAVRSTSAVTACAVEYRTKAAVLRGQDKNTLYDVYKRAVSFYRKTINYKYSNLSS
jgi:hypothetical protein